MSLRPGSIAVTQSTSLSFLLAEKKSSHAISHCHMTIGDTSPGVSKGMRFGSACKHLAGVFDDICRGNSGMGSSEDSERESEVSSSDRDADVCASSSASAGATICAFVTSAGGGEFVGGDNEDDRGDSEPFSVSSLRETADVSTTPNAWQRVKGSVGSGIETVIGTTA
jgi:hypothetical protein